MPLSLPFYLCKVKNQFDNRLSDDHSRVILRRRDDKPESDYINANYIRAPRLNDSTNSVQSSNESLDSIHCEYIVLQDALYE